MTVDGQGDYHVHLLSFFVVQGRLGCFVLEVFSGMKHLSVGILPMQLMINRFIEYDIAIFFYFSIGLPRCFRF